MISLNVRESELDQKTGFDCGSSDDTAQAIERASVIAAALKGSSLTSAYRVTGPELRNDGDVVVTLWCAAGILWEVMPVVGRIVDVMWAGGRLVRH